MTHAHTKSSCSAESLRSILQVLGLLPSPMGAEAVQLTHGFGSTNEGSIWMVTDGAGRFSGTLHAGEWQAALRGVDGGALDLQSRILEERTEEVETKSPQEANEAHFVQKELALAVLWRGSSGLSYGGAYPPSHFRP